MEREYYEDERPPRPINHLADPDSEKIDTIILDQSYIVDELVRTLRGQIVDNVTNEIRDTGQPLVEERAVAWLVSRFNPYVSKIFTLSFLDERNIKEIIFEFESELICELIQPEVVGVPKRNRDLVKNLMVHALVSSLWKSHGGATMKNLLQSIHVSETTVNQQQQKTGWFKKRMTDVGEGVRI